MEHEGSLPGPRSVAHWSLSWATWIQLPPLSLFKVHFNIILHPHVDIPRGLETVILYTLLMCPHVVPISYTSTRSTWQCLVRPIHYSQCACHVRGSVVGWGTMLQTGRSRVPVPMRWIFFNWPNPTSRTMALGSTQPLTEMCTRKIPGG
jgi:hypothetical protein